MTTPAPGWYPAPDGQPYERWWDGSGWSEGTRPVTAQPTAAAAQPSRMVTRERVRTSHTFHLLMSIFTGGLWAVFVWLPMTILNSLRRRRVVTKIKY